MAECEHNYQHIGTEYVVDGRGRYQWRYKMIDRFFCTRCLETVEKISKEEWAAEKPYWFHDKIRGAMV